TTKEQTLVGSGGTSHAGQGGFRADSMGRRAGKEASGTIWFSFTNNSRSAESPFRAGESAPGVPARGRCQHLWTAIPARPRSLAGLHRCDDSTFDRGAAINFLREHESLGRCEFQW